MVRTETHDPYTTPCLVVTTDKLENGITHPPWVICTPRYSPTLFTTLLHVSVHLPISQCKAIQRSGEARPLSISFSQGPSPLVWDPTLSRPVQFPRGDSREHSDLVSPVVSCLVNLYLNLSMGPQSGTFGLPDTTRQI